MPTRSISRIKIADEVWIATALLHRRNPLKEDFTVKEIIESAANENVAGAIRPGLYVHIVQHCVANRPPNPGPYRMLFETAPGRRRLFRKGDQYHPKREGSKIAPSAEAIPPEYSALLDWYRDWSNAAVHRAKADDPLLALSGSGKQLWSDEHADAYIRRLRAGWE